MIFRIDINLSIHKINILSVKKKSPQQTYACDVVKTLCLHDGVICEIMAWDDDVRCDWK